MALSFGKSAAATRTLLALAAIGSTTVVVGQAISILLRKDSQFHVGVHRFLVDSINGNQQQEAVSEELSFVFRPLFPLRPVDYVGFAAATLGLILAAGGGVGGGGFLVPIYILIMGFPVKPAASLSNVTVLGGAIANLLLNFSKRHPTVVQRPLIDWNFMAMMEPLTMAGALLGADLNEYLPDIMLVIMLVLLLGITTIRTLEKANKMHALESKNEETTTATIAARKEDEEALLVEAVSECPGPVKSGRALSYGTHGVIERGSISPELATFLEKESQVPWVRIAEILGLFLAVIGVNLLKGSGDNLQWLLPFDVTCGSPGFYWLGRFNLILIVGFAFYIRQDLIRDTAHKQAIQYKFVPGDILWNGRNTLVYSSICSVAGLVAGLFGIGGGVVMSPLMLEMGIHPAVSAATSATMILLTCFTATTSYMVHGELNHHYAVVCLGLGFVSTVVGQLLMDGLLAKYNRHSFIAYSIALVVGISAVAMTVDSVLAIAQGSSRQGAGMCSSVQHTRIEL